MQWECLTEVSSYNGFLLFAHVTILVSYRSQVAETWRQDMKVTPNWAQQDR